MNKIIEILRKPKLVKLCIGYFLSFTRLSELFVIEMGGFKLRFFPSAYSLTLWVYKDKRENIDSLFFEKVLKKGDYVIDVGANVGALTLLASSIVGDKGRVVSYEAHPKTFQYLTKNVLMNNMTNIVTYNYALGDKEDVLFFENRTRTDDQNKVLSQKRHELSFLEVIQMRLDSFSNSTKIDLLKVDVEGYELFVFKGAVNTLQITDCIYFESWEKHFNNYNLSTSEVLLFLQEQGFEIFKPDLELENLTLVTANYTSSFCENLIALKDIKNFIKKTGFKVI